MLPIIKEYKLKTKSKKLLRLAIIFVTAFSISTPAVMFLSAGAVTLNLFVEGFWIIGLLQALAFTTIVDYCTESKHTNKYFSDAVGTNERERQYDPIYAYEIDNIWHGTDLDWSSEEYWK